MKETVEGMKENKQWFIMKKSLQSQFII